MVGKIEAEFTNRHFSIRFSKDNHDENAMNHLSNWNNLLPDLVVAIVENKAAIAQVYTSDGDFEFPEIRAKIWTRKHESKTYFMAASQAWVASDVLEITCLMQFELGALWIQIAPEIDEGSVDPANFFKSVDNIILGQEEDDKFQCVGIIEDGDVIFWTNPNADEVIRLLPQLKTICLNHGFEWFFNHLR